MEDGERAESAFELQEDLLSPGRMRGGPSPLLWGYEKRVFCSLIVKNKQVKNAVRVVSSHY